MKRLALIVAMFVMLGGWSLRATAEKLRESEMAQIRSAVQAQIEALAKDDAVKAFDLTTEDTRNRLGSPDNFLKMIKEKYDPVYRHRMALYSSPQIVLGKVYQAVRLTDLDSHVWVAIYLMHKDEEGTWKIDGCQLVQTMTIAV
ncbi:MAG TPA: hypothetical protein DHV59_17890 [Oxalobacteraceae bacterium]|nr:hypothetical protein [Oxalobacteraceae bacterium]